MTFKAQCISCTCAYIVHVLHTCICTMRALVHKKETNRVQMSVSSILLFLHHIFLEQVLVQTVINEWHDLQLYRSIHVHVHM